jgi:hypothetical protein
MRPKMLITTLLAVLALSAFGASYAAGAGSPAKGAKRLLKRRAPAPTPVLVVDYEPSTGHAPDRHYAVESSLAGIQNFLSKSGQQNAKKPPAPTQDAKGLETSTPVRTVTSWRIR